MRLLLAPVLLAAAAAVLTMPLPAAMAGDAAGPAAPAKPRAAGGGAEAPLVEVPLTVPPSYSVKGKDSYVCVVKALPAEPHKLVGVKPLADESVVHHILLYGAHLARAAHHHRHHHQQGDVSAPARVPSGTRRTNVPPPRAGCSNSAQQPPKGETVAWNCFHHGVCGGGGSEIL